MKKKYPKSMRVTRYGLMLVTNRGITLVGIKPVVKIDYSFVLCIFIVRLTLKSD